MNKREEFKKTLMEVLKRGDKEELENYSIEALKTGWYIFAYRIIKKYKEKGYGYNDNIDFSLGVVRAMMFFNMKKAYKKARYKDTRRYILEIIGLNDRAYDLLKETFKDVKESYPALYEFRHGIFKMFRGEIPQINENVEIRSDVEPLFLKLAKGMAEMMKGNYKVARDILYEDLHESLDIGHDHNAMFVLRFMIPVMYHLGERDAAMYFLELGKDMADGTGNRWFFELFEIYRAYMDGMYPEYMESKLRFYIDRWALIHELLTRGFLHINGRDHARRIMHIVDEHHHHHDLKVMELLGFKV